MRILYVADLFSGCTWYRCVVPGFALKEAGHEVHIRIKECSRADIEWCDVLVAQRLLQESAVQAVNLAKAMRKRTIYDLDDDLWAIGPDNGAAEFWNDEKHQRGAVEVMRACDFCTTTNEYLADIMRRFVDDVRVIPNALPDDFLPVGEHEGLVLGWAGSASHGDDLRSMADMLIQVLEERPHVRCEMASFAELLEPHPRITQLKPERIERYHHLVSRFDIGIAPLRDTRFNRCKSDLKFLEYAGLGIPSVCSEVRPYAETVEHGVTGFLARSPKDWRRYLLKLIDDEQLRKEMAGNAAAYAETRRISVTLPLWESVMA